MARSASRKPEYIVYQTGIHAMSWIAPIAQLFLGLGIAAGCFLGMQNGTFKEAAVVGLVGMFMGGMFALFSLGSILGGFSRYLSGKFTVTEKRVSARIGIMQSTAFELQLHQVEGIAVQQSIFGKMFGYGTVVITGTGGSSEGFHYVVDPYELQATVEDMIDERMNGDHAPAYARVV